MSGGFYERDFNTSTNAGSLAGNWNYSRKLQNRV